MCSSMLSFTRTSRGSTRWRRRKTSNGPRTPRPFASARSTMRARVDDEGAARKNKSRKSAERSPTEQEETCEEGRSRTAGRSRGIGRRRCGCGWWWWCTAGLVACWFKRGRAARAWRDLQSLRPRTPNHRNDNDTAQLIIINIAIITTTLFLLFVILFSSSA